MPGFVALLRGVNVGKAKRLPMATLRALLAERGYTGISTLLNSGNAVFRASAGNADLHAAAISTAIARGVQLEVPVVVKSAAELAAIVSENALAENAADPSRLLVAFVQDPKALAELAAVERLIVPPEKFLRGPRAAYFRCAGSLLESKAGAALLGTPGRAATTRNWATVLKLQALLTDSKA